MFGRSASSLGPWTHGRGIGPTSLTLRVSMPYPLQRFGLVCPIPYNSVEIIEEPHPPGIVQGHLEDRTRTRPRSAPATAGGGGGGPWPGPEAGREALWLARRGESASATGAPIPSPGPDND